MDAQRKDPLSGVRAWRACAMLAAILVAGCTVQAKPAPPPAPPQVGYVVLTAEDAPLETELAGRTAAFETSEVRPQVSGVIEARRFVEGSIVQQGQTLYEIDPSLYRASAAQARAALVNAQANEEDAKAKLARYEPLVAQGFVTKQDYDDVVAAAKQAAAQVGEANAALDTAGVNLHFTRVPAPITGRVGRSMATTGALVTNGQAGALTTIERLDPMFVDIQQSSADLIALRRSLFDGGSAPSSTSVTLTLEDGSPYPHAGRIEFAEAIVDPDTGSVTLRARFPNPDGLLLPGMFVRAALTQAVARGAILVPQQAVSRTPRGDATVFVLGAGNRAELRAIEATRTVGDKWLVTRGLSAGDKVITEGLDRLRPGRLVRAVPASSPPAPLRTGRASG